MKARRIRLRGIRSFDDTGWLELSPKCNVFLGRNNAGKSTILRSLLSLQHMPFNQSDVRPDFFDVCTYDFFDVSSRDRIQGGDQRPFSEFRVSFSLTGHHPAEAVPNNMPVFHIGPSEAIFENQRPANIIVPFLAKRKAMSFEENVSSAAQATVTGTYNDLYGRFDRIITAGHPKHQLLQDSLREIVGLPITTRPSPNGKQAGIYLNDDERFITLDQMGDGIVEMVALIVELCSENRKIFILEEPETFLHPQGLKALIGMVRSSSESNQFIIATHSNIVLRELGFDVQNKIFKVSKREGGALAPSSVEEIPYEPRAHTLLLKELGYDFADLALPSAWLILEESSAETIISQILIPRFVPALIGKLRSFSAAGATKLEATIGELQRLVTFIHLQPAYEGRLWVWADGDAAGESAIAKLRQVFPYLNENCCSCFQQPAFERYYPAAYQNETTEILGIADSRQRRARKADLLSRVLQESSDGQLTEQWAACAAEVITMLNQINSSIA